MTYQKIRQLEEAIGRPFYLIAESDLNSPKVVKSPAEGGYGFNAQWLDDFHHVVYKLINPSDKERYCDFGTIEQLVKAYNEGFVHSGQWVKFRKRKYGISSAGIPGDKFVVFNQNHDQVGNRADGKRLCMLVDHERMKLSAAAVLLAPYVPMLFMGEEYADPSPFYYFVSHSDNKLIKAVQEGRRKEFEEFGFDQNIPDPQDTNTFLRCKLQWEKRYGSHHKVILDWHRALIGVRKKLAPFSDFDKEFTEASAIGDQGLVLFRHDKERKQTVACFFNYSEKEINYSFSVEEGFTKILDSRDDKWRTSKKVNNEVHRDKITSGASIRLLPLSVVVYSSQ